MKRHKILIPILFTLFLFLVFLGTSILWKTKQNHSSAGSSTSIVKNHSSETLLTVNTTFYNYRYDREIYDGKRDQGAQSCYDGAVIPFGTFDKALSDYYKANKVQMGIYAGNFYMYYGGLEGVGNNKLEFPGYYNFRWAANIANRNSPYNSVCQGIVADTLHKFDITDDNSGTLMASTTSGQVSVPYFDQDFLNTKVNNVAIGAVKENVGFPFRKVTSGSKKGYYEFDSTKDVVRFKDMWNQTQDSTSNDKYYFGTEGILDYYYKEQFVYSRASDSPQFLPYNKAGGANNQTSIDYGFGVRFNIPFFLSDNGTINGKNMVFEFSGDDDVWIFLDGKLVLDLGGQHGKATGTIDFGGANTTAKVTNQTVTYVNGSTHAADTVLSDKILAEDTYVKSKITTINNVAKGDTNKHVLTIFYMERGMFESNFHMAFNFVPEGEPLATATPEPTDPPNPENIKDGNLTIQNKMIFPTTMPDENNQTESKINPAFLETVKDLAEDDVFQYSIQNKGTKAEHVVDNQIKYPSGKLTVRENGSDTLGKKKSYLSFGAKPMVRIYFDFSSAKNIVSTEDNNVKWGGSSKLPCVEISGKHTKMTVYQGEIYYADVQLGDWFKLTNGTSGCSTQPALQASTNQDGAVFRANSLSSNGTLNGTWTSNAYPALNTGGGAKYSSGLPYQDAGTSVNKFTPTDATIFNNVSNTAYELTEAYLAPTDSNILINSKNTSGITNASGLFGLFYDDSATFQSQFATGSTMKVIQEGTLWTPTRYSGSMSSSMDANTALTTFGTSASPRKTADYYYTTIQAESKSADGSITETVDVTYDGQYSFSNGASISKDEPVNITETFTNIMKTGSLTISKELKGNMDDANNYSYGFRITFSNVFGGNNAEAAYSGSYTLIKKDGTETTKTTTNGIIVLKPSQEAVISGIPVGTAYKIEEVDENGNTITDGSVVSEIQTTYTAQIEEESITSPVYKATNDTAGIKVDQTNRTISGVIPCSVVDKLYENETNIFTEVNVSVAYTNQFGALSITKKIAGDVNNSTYYGTNADGTSKIKYSFTVLDEGNSYQGDYLVYTYTYEHGPNMPPTITSEKRSTTDGTILLKEGQKAEIGGISLSGNKNHKYTITENVKDDDIFFVEQLKVTNSTTSNGTTANSSITTMNNSVDLVLSPANSSFDVVYSNRYSNAYLTIEKFVDKVYYDGKEYSSGLTYQQLTNANQSFIFHVKQYKTLADAKAGNDQYEASFEIVLSMGEDSTELSPPETFGTDSIKYNYKLNKTVQVLGNRYYRIEEDTNWSWKYQLKGVDCADKNTQSTTIGNVVILKGYLDTVNELEDKDIPVAKFYNSLNSDVDIEGDTDNVINKIKLPKTLDFSPDNP